MYNVKFTKKKKLGGRLQNEYDCVKLVDPIEDSIIYIVMNDDEQVRKLIRTSLKS